MSNTRYLTKSRFKVAYECPTKLYYLDRPEYGNNDKEDTFLKNLAEGGFQVGALAKLYFPGGTEVETLNPDDAVKQTEELLKQERVIIYEAAIRVDHCLVRVDILRKSGDALELIEVKAKSHDPSEKDPWFNKKELKKNKKEIKADWKPYLIDVAFQAYVLRKAFPKSSLTCSLLLADKTAQASVDGLNQRFFIDQDPSGRTRVMMMPQTSPDVIGDPILVQVNVDEPVKVLQEKKYLERYSFSELVTHLSDLLKRGEKAKHPVSGLCKNCEFRMSDEQLQSGIKSGFHECWMAHGLTKDELKRPMVFDVWDFRDSGKLVEEKTYFMDQMNETHFNQEPDGKEGLSHGQRQWLQVRYAKKELTERYIDYDPLDREMKRWVPPYHFIDFETTTVAVPFYKGRRPYEQIAFQFSHHVVNKDGSIEHRDQFLFRERGKFPNYEFLRALKKSLSGDEGTIFRYSTHENTVLCQIRRQLIDDPDEIPDREELCAWIESITQSGKDSVEQWKGKRNMVDLWDLVKRYYYHPLMGGSNSIKQVLPAILADSELLQMKYAQPIYGALGEIKSLNYKNKIWIERDVVGNVIDPYKQLPELFTDIQRQEMDLLVKDERIGDGGAALTAYARMQFTQMSETEVERVCQGLLQYCELDTLAMVMIWEYWQEQVKKEREKAAA